MTNKQEQVTRTNNQQQQGTEHVGPKRKHHKDNAVARKRVKTMTVTIPCYPRAVTQNDDAASARVVWIALYKESCPKPVTVPCHGYFEAILSGVVYLA